MLFFIIISFFSFLFLPLPLFDTPFNALIISCHYNMILFRITSDFVQWYQFATVDSDVANFHHEKESLSELLCHCPYYTCIKDPQPDASAGWISYISKDIVTCLME